MKETQSIVFPFPSPLVWLERYLSSKVDTKVPQGKSPPDYDIMIVEVTSSSADPCTQNMFVVDTSKAKQCIAVGERERKRERERERERVPTYSPINASTRQTNAPLGRERECVRKLEREKGDSLTRFLRSD